MENTIDNILHLLERIDPQYRDYSLLTEGITDVVYHFTSIKNAYNIAIDDCIYLQSAFAKDSDNFSKKKKFYLSCTRQRNANFGYSKKFNRSGGVRIALDGRKLSERLSGRPVNYWGSGGSLLNDKFSYYKNLPKDYDELKSRNYYDISRKKSKNPDFDEEEYLKRNFNDSAQHHIDNESEDRIFSNEPWIRNLHEYLISIDVLVSRDDNYTMNYAKALRHHTVLYKYVKIFDSEIEFNKKNGKTINDDIEYETEVTINTNGNDEPDRLIRPLSAVINFITINDDKKDIGKKIKDLLNQYQLGEFEYLIGNLIIKRQRAYNVKNCMEELDSARRELSDSPSKENAKILKMLTDHMRSIGANSFRDAYLIKKNEERFKYKENYLYSDEIDYDKRLECISVWGDYYVSIKPDKELFYKLMRWNENNIKEEADMVANSLYNEDNQFKGSSKNYQSLFHYIEKLFRTGTVAQVIQVLEKLGADEFINDNQIEVKQMSYDDLSYKIKYDDKMSYEDKKSLLKYFMKK